jgi:sugar phosphate isomerase/epimerase
LAIENLPRADGSWICRQLLGQFDNGQLGFCYDSSHENISGGPFHLIKTFYNRLTCCHLSDNRGLADDHLPPGEGIIDWDMLFSYIRKSKLRNILFEIGTGEKLNEPPDKYIEKTITFVRKYFTA